MDFDQDDDGDDTAFDSNSPSQVVEHAVLERLDPVARGNVLQADLHSQDITDYGEPSGGGIELFFQDKPMTLARWPNQGFVEIAQVLGPTAVGEHGAKGCAEGVFAYEGDRPGRWVAEKDVWLHGYWFWDWSDQRQKVEAIDQQKRTITLAKPHHHYGYRKGQWFYRSDDWATWPVPDSQNPTVKP
ncbi:MAG: hypothetical protein A2V70_14675 [Planctomycetes bacterium RBG_13_63_9]|nr:MAG: hypothetical protein A2V70_14675 [Planctomycetes bacterium RBG_13_63_9]